MKTDVVVVGAGIIGLLTALELAKTGLNVVVIDKQRPGNEASWAGGGILCPIYPWLYSAKVNRLVAWSQKAYVDLAKQLKHFTGIDPERVETGMLVLDESMIQEGSAWCEANLVAFEFIKKSDCELLQPGLGVTGHDMLYLPKVANIRNPHLLKSLVIYLSSFENVTLLMNSPVKRVLRTCKNGRRVIMGVELDHEVLLSPRVVIAAGAWSHFLLEELGFASNLIPIRGEMLLYHAKPSLLKRVLLYKEQYLIPRQDGVILVGSTRESVGFNKSTTESGLKKLRAVAETILPELKRYEVKHRWAGLRPAAMNVSGVGASMGGPYIGAVDDFKGLYVNTGHFTTGLTTAPASAHLLKQVILADTAAILATSQNENSSVSFNQLSHEKFHTQSKSLMSIDDYLPEFERCKRENPIPQ